MKIKFRTKKVLEKIKFGSGELLTSKRDFISPLYVDIKEVDRLEDLAKKAVKRLKNKYFSHYEEICYTEIGTEGWRGFTYGQEVSYTEKVPVYKKDGKEIKIEYSFPGREVSDYIKPLTKEIYVRFDDGFLFEYFKANVNDEIVTLADENGDIDFDTFEEYLQKFYGLEDYALIFHPASENSPLHVWENYENYLVVKDIYYFIHKKFIKKMQKFT